MKTNCIFCNLSKIGSNKQLLWDDKDFSIIHDGFPISSPHLLLIPKNHFTCYAEIFNEIELNKKVQKIINSLFEIIPNLGLFFEHGDVGQTVKHAHIHLVPNTLSLENLISEVGVKGKTTKLNQFSDLKEHQNYLLFGNKENSLILNPESIATVEPGVITNYLAKKNNKPFPAKYRTPVQESDLINLSYLRSLI